MAKLAKLPPRMATMGSKLSAPPVAMPTDRPAFGHDTSRHARGYGTAWTKLRKVILKRDNYECQECKRQGGYSKATDVHHIKHLETHPELALYDDNLESLCAACHNRAHPEKLKPPAVKEREALTPERW